MVSRYSCPGSPSATRMSTRPGHSTAPWPSTTAAPSGDAPSGRSSPAISPSSTRRRPGRSSPVAGSSSRTLLNRMRMVMGGLGSERQNNRPHDTCPSHLPSRQAQRVIGSRIIIAMSDRTCPSTFSMGSSARTEQLAERSGDWRDAAYRPARISLHEISQVTRCNGWLRSFSHAHDLTRTIRVVRDFMNATRLRVLTAIERGATGCARGRTEAASFPPDPARRSCSTSKAGFQQGFMRRDHEAGPRA